MQEFLVAHVKSLLDKVIYLNPSLIAYNLSTLNLLYNVKP